MDKDACGNGRFLTRFLWHGQHALKCIGRLPHRYVGFHIIRFCGHLAAHQHVTAIADRFFFRRYEFEGHDFPIILFVLMGKVHVQVLLFHNQMKHMRFQLIFRLFKAAIASQLDKGACHPFQIGQHGLIGFHGHVAADLKVIVAPQATHGFAFDVVQRILTDRFLIPHRHAVLHLLGGQRYGGQTSEDDRQHQHQGDCAFHGYFLLIGGASSIA